MNKTLNEEKSHPIWIDHTNKILSFQSAEGFEQLHFSSHEENMAFAVEKSSSGYRIQ